MRLTREYKWYWDSILNSYSQVFFSNNKPFALIILLVTFVDFYTGLFGIFSILITTFFANWLGFNKFRISQGYYGFNSLLIGLGLGVYFQPSLFLFFIVMIAAVLTLFISVALEGIIGKYALPSLSLPFVFSLWVLMLAAREFQVLGLNERGIYTFNDLYVIGGNSLVKIYEWWTAINMPDSVRSYFLSLGAIFFQYNILTGILVAIGLLVYSRIGFTLSLLGFYTAYYFYILIGVSFSEVTYSYIGFNYILSAIAIGGYFIIPNRNSYLGVIITIPIVAVLTISLNSIFTIYGLPIYSLPFNIVALLILYVLKFRVHNKAKLNPVIIQQNSPEKNLYSHLNYQDRFGKDSPIPIYLPFFGEWVVTQGHNGKHTHLDDWKHAWDFEIYDENEKSYKNSGDFVEDYFCYGKTVVAPADGSVEEVVNDIPNNVIGEKNLENNWGNTVVLKHSEYIYTKVCHLDTGSIILEPGTKVKRDDVLGKCGNSGNSPYPHLHFQVQATPFIGSKTIDYPISNYFLRTDNDKVILKTVAVPKNDDITSNMSSNSAMRKSFQFIPGEKIYFSVTNNVKKDIEWEVKYDYYLNKYIACEESQSKAFFKCDDNMLYFTHFEGNHNSLLYFFHLAAYKVSLDYREDMVLHDTYPLSTVINQNNLFLQDFIAPFYRFKRCKYILNYTGRYDSLIDSEIILKSNCITTNFGKISSEINFEFTIDNSGITKFSIQSKNKDTVAICIKM